MIAYDYSSELVPNPNASLSPRLGDFSTDTRNQKYKKEDSQISGPSTFIQNTMVNESFVSECISGFEDIYFHRVHITPRNIDLGAVLRERTIEVYIWNTNPNQVTLNNLISTSNEFQIQEPEPRPLTFNRFQERKYTITISRTGDTQLAGNIEWQFDVENISLNISGLRVYPFLVKPNWKQPIQETLTYLTDVVKFYKAEKRRALRDRPRRTFQMLFTLSGKAASTFDHALSGWQSRIYSIPVRTEVRTLSEPVAGTTVNVNPQNLSYQPGGFLIFDNKDIVQIESLSDVITLKEPVNQPAGVEVMPMLNARVPSGVNVSRLNDSILQSSVRFEISPEDNQPNIPVEAATTTYEDIEVITEQPNWKSGISNQYTNNQHISDNQTGPIHSISLEEGSITRQYQWLLKGEEITRWRGFIGRLKGQFNEVWVPSWHSDFSLVNPIGETDTTITIENADHELLFSDKDKYIAVILNDGRQFYRKITGYTQGTHETLHLDSALGTNATLKEVLFVCHLWRCRCATDDALLLWSSTNVATGQLSFKTL